VGCATHLDFREDMPTRAWMWHREISRPKRKMQESPARATFVISEACRGARRGRTALHQSGGLPDEIRDALASGFMAKLRIFSTNASRHHAPQQSPAARSADMRRSKEASVRGSNGSHGKESSRPDADASLDAPSADMRHVYDRQLLAQIVAGDRLAYTLFYDRHAPRILGLLVRGLRHRADAEDVLQDTFYQVWRCAAQYSADRSSPEVWLMLLARSRLLDYVRRKRPDATGALANTEAPSYDPLAELTRAESAERLRRALLALPEEQRAAISMSFFTGLTHQQIAEQQAIPLGTAKTRILLGVRSLRKLLSPPREASI
jgi:RNA polymerase sigma-70 factor, ECF subfamily